MAILGPFDFRGGYSPGYDFTTLPQGKGYATIMRNCRVRSGYMTPRWGQKAMSDADLGGSVLGLTSWKDTPNSKTAVVATANNKLFIADATSYQPGSSAITFTDRTGALASSSVGGLTTFDSLNNILVGSSVSTSSGVLFKVTAYNANGAVLAGSPPPADIVKQCNNFMFASRNLSSTTTQSNVYWSNVNDPETWTAANVLAFNKNDGEPIMALGAIGTDLYIFKQSSIGRLSTVTITTSGAVTLGPLVTVIRGVGCCGPRALDNLPNGNIVFVSFDGHFYEFDGSTLIDRSREPHPGHDAYDDGKLTSGVIVPSPRTNAGLAFCIPNTSVLVKTVRGINEVWISFGISSLLSGALSAPTFHYDFEQGIWQGVSDRQNSTSLGAEIYPMFSIATLTATNLTSANVESSDFVIYGASSTTGKVFSTGNPAAPSPVDSNGTGAFFEIGTTIDLMTERGPFIPRSLCFETSETQTTGSLPALIVYAGFDIYNPATSIYSPTTGQLPNRIIVPISFLNDPIGSNVFPAKLSILWNVVVSGSGFATGCEAWFRLGKFWLSDEIVR